MTFATKLSDKTIEVDLSCTKLADILRYCKPKEQMILIEKFGLRTGTEIALQKIGEKFSMTRERIRQLQNHALMKFRRLIIGNDVCLDVIEKAKAILKVNGGLMSESSLISSIYNQLDPADRFSMQEIKLIVRSDYHITHLSRNRHLYKSFYLDGLYEVLIENITLFAVEYFETNKDAVNIYDMINIIKEEFVAKHPDISFLSDNNFYINLFGVIRGVSIFDSKVGMSTNRVVNPKTIKSKILYIYSIYKKPLHYSEVANLIMDHFPNKAVKLPTIHNQLVKAHDAFINVGMGMYVPQDRGYKGGTVLQIIEEVLTNTNRKLNISELNREVLKHKMVSTTTLSMNLNKYKDKFFRDAKGYYGLVGKTYEN